MNDKIKKKSLKYTVYKITNLINGKIYIGYTSWTLDKRFKKHITNINTKNPMIIGYAIAKYGIENFKIESIYECENKNEALNKEIELIALHNSRNRNIGYNVSKGGEEFLRIDNKTTEELAKIRSEKFKGSGNPFYGKTHDEATKKKIADRPYHKGEEHHLYGIPGPNSFKEGKDHKLSISITVNGQTFESISLASKELNIPNHKLQKLRKKQGNNIIYNYEVSIIRGWKNYELELLKQLYKQFNRAEIAKILNRTEDGIARIAAKLGLTTPHHHWSNDDVKILTDLYPTTPTSDLVSILNRSIGKIINKAKLLKLKKDHTKLDPRIQHTIPKLKANEWTEQEETKLREMFSSKFNSELAKIFNKSVAAINCKGSDLGLRKNAEVLKLWTNEEEQLLRCVYKTATPQELASTFNRNYKAVHRKARTLGLCKS